MKIRLQQNKRKGTISVSFRANRKGEGEALAKVVMNDLKGGHFDEAMPLKIVNGLMREGVKTADFDLAITEPKRKIR